MAGKSEDRDQYLTIFQHSGISCRLLLKLPVRDSRKTLTGSLFFRRCWARKQQKQHEYLYWEFHEQGGKTAVRMGNWKAVKRDIDKVPQGATELYDLSKDDR